ncbi:MAG TPA: Plug domain-containing protein, partial [Elusimicrobiota bacterium]|nr:Plug domain-containing protein [Elusimicrobiota bacterium]
MSGALAILLLALASRASGLPAASDPLSLPEIEIVAPTPLHGLGLDPDKLPNTTRIMSAADLSRGGEASLTGALDAQAGGVSLTDSFGNSNQPDLSFRGFTASPVEGTPQGLAVYQDGVRLNEAFGDTVNWDLIPDFAIDTLNLTSMNPVYGFNALGGAASIEMKNGFTFHGTEARASYGSFRRADGSAQYGASKGDWGGYLGMGGSSDSGWREGQPSRLQKFYGDYGYDD